MSALSRLTDEQLLDCIGRVGSLARAAAEELRVRALRSGAGHAGEAVERSGTFHALVEFDGGVLR